MLANLLSQQSKMHVNFPLAELAKQQIAAHFAGTWECGRNFAAAGMKLNQVFSFLVARSQHSNLLIKFNLRYCYAVQIKEGSIAHGTLEIILVARRWTEWKFATELLLDMKGNNVL